VQALPPDFHDSELSHALAAGWGIAASSIDYAPVGFGSYHWIVTGNDKHRLFATVDDLSHKAWLGDTCDAAFAGLRRAFDTALALRDRAGLQCVLAPLATIGGDSVHRLSRRYSIALFPYLEGEPGDFGDDTSARHRGDVVRMLVELHRATPAVQHLAAHLDLQFAGRAGLESALEDPDRAWTGGPFAEPAQAWLAGHAADLGRLLDDFDQLAVAVAAADRPPVITHGEPHPGNVLHGHDGVVLIDWDTVGLAPRERDLWMIATASGEETAQYADATGHEVSTAAMSLYRLTWQLTDIAVYLDQFRSPHHHTQDTEQAWLNLESAIRFEDS